MRRPTGISGRFQRARSVACAGYQSQSLRTRTKSASAMRAAWDSASSL
ncbi:hypothetical protein ACFPRL_23610 [Pseudoclavibacter helvolus]